MADRAAIVTGGSSGIGFAIARILLEEGYGVTVAARRPDKLQEAAEQLASAGGEVVHVAGNMGSEEVIAEVVATHKDRFGRLDVLVNNAGTTVRIPHDDFETASPEVFRSLFEVNVIGTWQVTIAAMPHLKAGGMGSIVNVSSLAGVRPTGSSIPYAVSKAALNHLTALLANVTGPDVRVNAVAPGLVDTPWTAGWDDLHDAVKLMAPMGRSAVPNDVAEVVTTLIHSTYVTGQVWVIDGGLGLR
jgi:ketoreductase RED2